MTDIWTKSKRSEVMSLIRSENTKPERLLRSALHKLGYRFRLYRKDLPGKPDLVFPKYNTVIFINGCFWHQHKNCIHGKIPKSNKEYWEPKLKANIQRDKKNHSLLRKQGWHVLVIWECEITKSPQKALSKATNFLKKHSPD